MIKVGEKLPDVQFSVPTSEGRKDMRTAEIFGGKTVALFAVPGAFTPTCSARHLPSFRDHAAPALVQGPRGRAESQGRRHNRLHVGQ